jgi:hypothetical protein
MPEFVAADIVPLYATGEFEHQTLAIDEAGSLWRLPVFYWSTAACGGFVCKASRTFNHRLFGLLWRAAFPEDRW